MASKTESDTRYWLTPTARVLTPQSTGMWVRQWFCAWRWPAGLVVGLVLWLALVAVVGAAPRVGSPVFHLADYPTACRVDVSAYYSHGIKDAVCSLFANADAMTTIFAIPLRKCGIDCRPGLPPRP